jgi:hypothetical protein
MNRPFLELRELEPGEQFLFFADDLPNRGPCRLIEKGPGSARIAYEPHQVTRRFKARGKDGQIIEREITETLSGESRCALGCQVVRL